MHRRKKRQEMGCEAPAEGSASCEASGSEPPRARPRRKREQRRALPGAPTAMRPTDRNRKLNTKPKGAFNPSYHPEAHGPQATPLSECSQTCESTCAAIDVSPTCDSAARHGRRRPPRSSRAVIEVPSEHCPPRPPPNSLRRSTKQGRHSRDGTMPCASARRWAARVPSATATAGLPARGNRAREAQSGRSDAVRLRITPGRTRTTTRRQPTTAPLKPSGNRGPVCMRQHCPPRRRPSSLHGATEQGRPSRDGAMPCSARWCWVGRRDEKSGRKNASRPFR